MDKKMEMRMSMSSSMMPLPTLDLPRASPANALVCCEIILRRGATMAILILMILL